MKILDEQIFCFLLFKIGYEGQVSRGFFTVN